MILWMPYDQKRLWMPLQSKYDRPVFLLLRSDRTGFLLSKSDRTGFLI